MTEKILIEGVPVVDTFEIPMSVSGKNKSETRYYKGYQGVVLEDGRKLMMCLEPGCTWTNPADKSPGGHKRVHRITASAALRDYSVGELVDALSDVQSLRSHVESLQGRLAAKNEKHREELKQAHSVGKEQMENWRNRARKAEGVLRTLKKYAPPNE